MPGSSPADHVLSRQTPSKPADHRLAVISIPDDREAAIRVLRERLRMNAIDARTRLRHVPAIWPEEFPASTADAAAEQLQALGGHAAAVRSVDVPDLRSARVLHHVRCQPDAFVVISLEGEVERRVEWSDVVFLSVADVVGLHQETSLGMPDGVFRHAPGITDHEPLPGHGLEMWLICQAPLTAFRMDAEWLNYEYLDARRVMSSRDNFLELVADIRRYAPRLTLTPYTERSLRASVTPDDQMPSPAAHRDAALAHWVIASQRRRPAGSPTIESPRGTSGTS